MHDPVLSHLLFRALIADGAGSALISSIPDSGALRVRGACLVCSQLAHGCGRAAVCRL